MNLVSIPSHAKGTLMNNSLLVMPLSFFLLSASAYAWPGTVTVRCQSLPAAEKKVALVVSLTGTPTPDFPALVTLSIDDQAIQIDDPVRTAIAIVAHPTEKVITAAYKERSEGRTIDLAIWAKPDTIQGGVDSSCREDYQFRAGFGGSLYLPGNKPEDSRSASDYDDTLDCTYHSSPGSAGC